MCAAVTYENQGGLGTRVQTGTREELETQLKFSFIIKITDENLKKG